MVSLLLARVRLWTLKRLPFVGDATDCLQDVFFETSLLCHLSCNPTSRDYQNITGGNGIVIQRPVKRLQEEDGSSEMSEARGFGNGVGGRRWTAILSVSLPVHSAVGAEEAEIAFWKWRLSHILASHDNRSSGSWWTKMHSGIRRLVSIETCKQTQAHVSMSCARVWYWRISLPLRSLVDRMKRRTRRQLRVLLLSSRKFTWAD